MQENEMGIPALPQVSKSVQGRRIRDEPNLTETWTHKNLRESVCWRKDCKTSQDQEYHNQNIKKGGGGLQMGLNHLLGQRNKCYSLYINN